MDKTGYGDDDETDDKAFDKALDDIAEEEKAEEAEAEDAKKNDKKAAAPAAVLTDDKEQESDEERDADDLPDLSDEMKRIDAVIAKGPFSDDWASLSKVKVPDWFASERFGIFIHWGVFTS
jgi:hypothetical protein